MCTYTVSIYAGYDSTRKYSYSLYELPISNYMV